MKKFLMVLGLVMLLPVSESFALKGGPFANNTHGARRGGVYQIIMFIPNGNGIARFSDEADTAISTFSDSVVFFKGIIYVGNAFGVVDLGSGYVSGMTNGTSNGQQNSGAQGGLATAGTAPTSPQTEGRAFSSSGGNVGICNTSFTGKVEKEGAMTRMSGRGVANFFGELDTTTIAQDLTTTTSNTVDGVTTNVTTTRQLRSTLGENSSFGKTGVSVGFQWFGTRINTNVPTPRTDTVGGTVFVANPGLIGPLPGSPGQDNVPAP